MATFEEQYRKYSTSGQGQAINDLYDAKKQSQLTQLESAYQESRAEAEAARDKLPGQYRQQANDLAAQYERNRRNFNLQADASGLNTGAASQAALAQNSAYQRDIGALRTAQADAMTEADRGIADLERQYQANVSSAIADNDYQRAQALMNEYNNGYSRDLNTAKTLAAYGDFSGYAGLYGQETADSMAALWKAQNPELAYNTGRMTAEEYRAVTGKYPAGYKAPHTPRYNPNPVPVPETEPASDAGQVSDTAKAIANTIATGSIADMQNALAYASQNSGSLTEKELDLIANALESGRSIYNRNQYHGGR